MWECSLLLVPFGVGVVLAIVGDFVNPYWPLYVALALVLSAIALAFPLDRRLRRKYPEWYREPDS